MLAAIPTLALNKEKCTGCQRCVQVCPHAVFEMKDKKADIVALERCMECGACQLNCADGALSVETGTGCAQAIIRGAITGTEPSCGCEGDSGGSGCC